MFRPTDYLECLAAQGEDLCDETHPSDGQRPVKPKEETGGGSGRQDTGHGQRTAANDDRGKKGHAGHQNNPQRPIEEQ